MPSSGDMDATVLDCHQLGGAGHEHRACQQAPWGCRPQADRVGEDPVSIQAGYPNGTEHSPGRRPGSATVPGQDDFHLASRQSETHGYFLFVGDGHVGGAKTCIMSDQSDEAEVARILRALVVATEDE
jgi:hypothetical protein